MTVGVDYLDVVLLVLAICMCILVCLWVVSGVIGYVISIRVLLGNAMMLADVDLFYGAWATLVLVRVRMKLLGVLLICYDRCGAVAFSFSVGLVVGWRLKWMRAALTAFLAARRLSGL